MATSSSLHANMSSVNKPHNSGLRTPLAKRVVCACTEGPHDQEPYLASYIRPLQLKRPRHESQPFPVCGPMLEHRRPNDAPKTEPFTDHVLRQALSAASKRMLHQITAAVCPLPGRGCRTSRPPCHVRESEQHLAVNFVVRPKKVSFTRRCQGTLVETGVGIADLCVCGVLDVGGIGKGCGSHNDLMPRYQLATGISQLAKFAVQNVDTSRTIWRGRTGSRMWQNNKLTISRQPKQNLSSSKLIFESHWSANNNLTWTPSHQRFKYK